MKLSEKKKELLRKFVSYKCEECGIKDKKLEPHRINQGGEYSIRNIKIVCHKCHNLFSSAQRIAQGTQSK